MRLIYSAALWVALVWSVAVPSHGAQVWTEGVNYFLVQPARPANVAPGKVEVTEVFSYACPACNIFQPTVHKLKQSLPTNAVLDYLPAAFNTGEDWPMFQLAYVTAQVLGVDQQTHDAMFDAVWKGGDLSITDPSTRGLKSRMPSIEDAAKFYNQRAGVPVDKFLAASKSFSADLKVRTDQDLIVAYKVDRTPTIIVNGKYRLHVESAGGPDQLIDLVKYLVAKETK
ncbi:MAG TPA: thiol:disulfide interchange protein DsbA/DsbL [Steroidobacteraceae bacterium]|jgi:thiol:disulfide interchange protein DsbA|nr:thiol:disulfide interchange protein DsbA/DsbL [Steroidobacteraceae bacterium]